MPRRKSAALTTLALTLAFSGSLAKGQKMYWADAGTHKIQRANLDGSDIADVATRALYSPLGIALDSAAGKMYGTDWAARSIQRADLEGSNV